MARLTSYIFLSFLITAHLKGWSQKINGVCTVAPSYEVLAEHFDPILQIHAKWIAVVPYAFCTPNYPTVIYDHPRQWRGEKPEGIAHSIRLAKMKGLKVMIKPHLWVKGQGWAGDLDFNNAHDLMVWQESYKKYLMVYATLADSLDVDLIAIGTELKKLIQDKKYWTDLICEIRNVYGGDLTYAANWDNYKNVSFWNQLEYIGIDAYFPVNDELTPTHEEVHNSFSPIIKELKAFSKNKSRPVLFTEFGFRSIDHCANGHWIGDYENGNVNLACQQNAYQGLFDAFWPEPWFAGGFVWKWFYNNTEAGGLVDDKFTPQNKPAAQVIRRNYH